MTTNPDSTRTSVRTHYDAVARGTTNDCAPGCCGASPDASLKLGYTEEELKAVPEGANMGLGCGNPQAIASLKPGETVLDLGSGGGFDCRLAGRQVGADGHVIGVDMTASMVTKARANAKKVGAENVEFRLGEIEHLPVANDSVDVVISNCVLNLSPEKDRVYREMFRVLAPGGRIGISDVVAIAPIPEELVADAMAVSGCIALAAPVELLHEYMTAAGFEDVSIEIDEGAKAIIAGWMPGSGAENYVAPATIRATKRAADGCCEPECCA